MRERNLLRLMIALNVLLAGVMAVSLFPPHPRRGEAPPTSAGAALPGPLAAGIACSWENVESEDYSRYIERLRAAGCPPARLEAVVLTDIDEFFERKRLNLARLFDIEWWRDEPMEGAVNILREHAQQLSEARRELIARRLGYEPSAAEAPALWTTLELTGDVLGRLESGRHERVQSICAQSLQQQDSLIRSHSAGDGGNLAMELARARERTRAELHSVLNNEELTEFLLRYSHGASQLRRELSSFKPTPEEFRKLFAVLDPVEMRAQQQFGGEETMGQAQRQRYSAEREAAFRQALSRERYQAYLAAKQLVGHGSSPPRPM